MYILLTAVLLDLLIGDPKFYPHPVVLIGRIITYLDNKLRKQEDRSLIQKAKGILLVVLILTIIFGISQLILISLSNIHYYLALTFQILLFYTTIAIHGLHKAGMKIFKQLKKGELKQARQGLDLIVGRDTEGLSKNEIIRAVVETVAENTSDGIIAPIFYFLIGGPILALLYKTVNTMDSMLGYKNEKYKNFGWAAAKLDDFVNYLPARITGLLLVIAAFIYGKNYKKAFKILKRDAKKHDSPNAGYPEAAVAGALKVQLGGVNKYFGETSKKPLLGDKAEDFQISHIKEVTFLMYIATFIFIIFSLIFIYFIRSGGLLNY